MNTTNFFDIISLTIFILFDIFIIYFLISSKFMTYPPLIFNIGKTKHKIINELNKRIQIINPNNKQLTILDAGSGIGTILIPLAKNNPHLNFIGIEWSLLTYLISSLRSRKIKNLQIIKKNMFEYNFKEVDIVICFLIGSIMPRFTEKCTKELKDESFILSSRFKLHGTGFKLLETIDINDNFNYIFFYKKNDTSLPNTRA